LGGQVSKELLPNAYTFRSSYASNKIKQDSDSNLTVALQAGQVHSDSSACTHYYAGGWHTFANDMQLLPNVYTFRSSDGTPEPSTRLARVR
jgi:hypothetical protein